MKMLEKFHKNLYVKVFPNFPLLLEDAVGNCKSLLDVGCGSSSPIKSFSKNLYCVGVDGFQPSIEKSKKEKIHNKYYKMGILDIGKKFKPKSFDCVLASDVIEHLTKNDGRKLIKIMERLARKRIIIYTPNGFLPQGQYDGNPWQVHNSGWSVKEMRKRGYEVMGVNGWKPLRGELATVRFKPAYFWLVISDITELFVKKRPEHAFHILCVKNK